MGCRPRARLPWCFWRFCLPTFQPPIVLAFLHCLAGSPLPRFRQPPNSDVAAPKHHGSEWRIGPAAGISECQTLLSELPNFKPSIRLPTFQPPICLPCCTAGSPLLAFVDLQTAMSQRQNTMAVKDGSGPRPAVQSAKRCFLNCLETSFKLQTFHLLAYLPARQLLLSSFLAPGWWQCLLWRAPPCHRRGRRICVWWC